VIIAVGVSNQPRDVGHLKPMLERTIVNIESAPRIFIAIADNWSDDNVSTCQKREVDLSITLGCQKDGKPSLPLPLDGLARSASQNHRKERKESL